MSDENLKCAEDLVQAFNCSTDPIECHSLLSVINVMITEYETNRRKLSKDGLRELAVLALVNDQATVARVFAACLRAISEVLFYCWREIEECFFIVPCKKWSFYLYLFYCRIYLRFLLSSSCSCFCCCCCSSSCSFSFSFLFFLLLLLVLFFSPSSSSFFSSSFSSVFSFYSFYYFFISFIFILLFYIQDWLSWLLVIA